MFLIKFSETRCFEDCIETVVLVSGFFNAISTNTIITLNNGVLVTYPKLIIGSIGSIAGLVIAVLSYLVFHGKIELKRIFP